MAVDLPDDGSRWRCGHCGNLTRFDVVRSSRVREFWHLGLDGTPTVEEAVAESDVLESVTCRWCGASDRIETVPRPESDGPLEDSISP